MKNTLLFTAALLAAGNICAQSYITPAPEGGFNTATGKDYVVLYAPQNVIDAMGTKVISNNNLDKDEVNNYLEYWVTDWDKKDLNG